MAGSGWQLEPATGWLFEMTVDGLEEVVPVKLAERRVSRALMTIIIEDQTQGIRLPGSAASSMQRADSHREG